MPPFVYQLARELLSIGWSIKVLAPGDPMAPSRDNMSGIRVHRFRYFPSKYQRLCYGSGILANLKRSPSLYSQIVPYLMSGALNLLYYIRKEKYPVVNAHWLFPQGLIASVLKKTFKSKVVTTVHGGDIFALSKKFYIVPFLKMALNTSDAVTVNSSYTLKAIKKISPKVKIDHIPMGVDLSMFHPEKYNPKIKKLYNIKGPFLLFVGRLVPKKGLIYLIYAFKEISLFYPDAKLIIIGGGILEDRLRKETIRLGLEKKIIFLGRIAHELLPEYYATADIFIGPSIEDSYGDTEGLGVVFLEALASGCPVVASNVGGISDIVQNRILGSMASPKDTADLSKKIVELIESDTQLLSHRIERHNYIREKFSWPKVASRFSDLFQRLL